MTAPVEEVVAERLGVAKDLADEITAELRLYGQQTSDPKWDEAGTLGALIDDLREALVAVQALNR